MVPLPSHPRSNEAREFFRPAGWPRKILEADETFIGGKSTNRAYKPPRRPKEAVFTLVERDGRGRSFHVANVKAKTLREAMVRTDEAPHYVNVGREFALQGSINHSQNEYDRAGWNWYV
jgi:ISXO2-like transposase domain